MPIGTGIIYNVGDLILSQVSGSGTSFLETKIAAATSSIVYFDSTARINSASLNSITVGTASYVSGSTSIITNLTASNISASGTSSFGYVGIGTVNPSYKLDVQPTSSTVRFGQSVVGALPANTLYAFFGHNSLDHASTANNYALLQFSDGTTYLNASSGKTLNFRIANADKMVLDASGKLGIGTTAPITGYLDVRSSVSKTSTTTNIVFFGSNDGTGPLGLAVNHESSSGIKMVGLVGTEYGVSGNNIKINEILHVQYAGNVGIATTSPAYKLDVIGPATSNGVTLRLSDAASLANSRHILLTRGSVSGSIGIAGSQIEDPLWLSRSSGYDLIVASSGNVGVGTSIPGALLEVSSSTAASLLNVKGAGGNGILYVSGSGAVGIGTTSISDGARLTIAGETRIASSAAYFTHLNYLDGGNNIISSANGGSTIFRGSSNNITAMTILGSGNVGIGTSSPGGKFEIRTDASSNYIFSGSSTSGYTTTFTMDDTASYFGHDSSVRSLILRTNSTARLTVKGDGNVGIGTTSPTSKLHVVETTATGSRIQLGSSSTNALMNTNLVNDFLILTAPFSAVPASVSNNNAKWGIKMGGGSIDSPNALEKSACIYAVSEEDIGAGGAGAGYNRKVGLALHTSPFDLPNVERLRITNIGNVGIGTSNPSSKLEVYSAAKTSTFVGLSISNFNNYDGTAASLVKSQLRFAILESPTDTYNAAQRTFATCDAGNEANNSSSDGFFAVSTRLAGAVAEKFRITSAGNVGVGTTTPVGKLDVYGDVNGDHISFVRNANTGSNAITAIVFRRNGGNNGLVMFTNSSARTNDGGAGNSTIRTDNGKLLLGSNGTTYHALETDGNVGIGLTNPVAARLHIKGDGSNPVLRVETALLVAGTTTASKTFVGWMPMQTGALSPADTVYIPLFK